MHCFEILTFFCYLEKFRKPCSNVLGHIIYPTTFINNFHVQSGGGGAYYTPRITCIFEKIE